MKNRVVYVLFLLFVLLYSGYKIVNIIFYPTIVVERQTDSVAFKEGVDFGVKSLMSFVKEGQKNIDPDQVYDRAIKMRREAIK